MPDSTPDLPAVPHPVAPRPAATLVLLRDGTEGLELLMIERHGGLSFAPGASVFPGGRLEPADHGPGWHVHWPGRGIPADLAHRVAAVRETFEECGLLLADGPADPGRLAALRKALAAGAGFADALADAGLRPALDGMVPLARWVTPESLPRRFDALFFLAPAPVGQTPLCDGGEAVAAFWATPRRLLAEEREGARRLVFATRMSLLRLAACGGVEEALACGLHGRRALPPAILPRLVQTAAGPVFRIPEGCGFSPLETPTGNVRLG
ncbi:NUDIX hydrolase [Azospirillum picis]|uniref:8-oxo-dGTP pyrophosphatase MutT (NUDIX family) n=1 Tax=Azospirillum picis TaxID=488438 RepID=A0ABU0MHJ2_9PROT|nr:NUDIX domain-containing protein [Azospirillum picis]MBP2298833.1 8-oxo-dGTP pyrophosphatase MutT (NUDIX family) [Azospirillum picis]MDQ0532925.1 8-oxo-dGTP pyrophosphatase MutT (NUDIX family) [Azospirillum picis]